MNKKILHYTCVWLLLLFLNPYSFSQQRGERKSGEKAADTEQVSSFLKNPDWPGEWKQSRDFAYMNYLDSLLRSRRELRSDTVSMFPTPGESGRQEDNAYPATPGFLNSLPVRIFFWVLALFFIGFILYKIFLKSSLFATAKKRLVTMAEDEGIVLRKSTPWDLLIAEAESENDFNLSVRYLYLKTIQALSDKGLIHFAPDKINREYLEQMSVHFLANDFFFLTHSYEYIWYGKFVIDVIQYQKIKQQFIQFIKKVQPQ